MERPSEGGEKLRVPGIRLQQAFEGGDGVVRPLRKRVDAGEIQVGSGETGVQAKGILVGLHGLVVLAKLQIGVADVEVVGRQAAILRGRHAADENEQP
jgi:hypothetical protein